MEEKLAEKLLLCGFRPCHYGYRYLKKCVMLYIASDLSCDLLGSKLYKIISKDEQDKSPKTIEKNIKCAIDYAYNKGNKAYLQSQSMFMDKAQSVPTPCEFIAMLANQILYCDQKIPIAM